MTKRNKRSNASEKTLTLIKTIPIIIKSSQQTERDSFIETKCNCGEAIANTVEGSIGCIRYPECCDDDYEFI
jgi:hypothetical protein